MLTLVLSWCGNLGEAADVAWLGFRYATSIGLHRKAILFNYTEYIQSALLDVFWQTFIHTSIFQTWAGRDLPIDIDYIDVPIPICPEGSGVPYRIQAQLSASLIANKYYRHNSGLLLPGEARTVLAPPLSFLSSEDLEIYEKLNNHLDSI